LLSEVCEELPHKSRQELNFELISKLNKIIKISADKNVEHRYSRSDNGGICIIKLFI